MPNDEMGSRALPEKPDVDNRVVTTTIAGFLLFVAIAMGGLLFYLKANAPGALKQPKEHQFPEPALQKSPQNDLRQFENQQRSQLSGYGWVDRGEGLAKIPIGDAMQIIAGRGDHAFDPLDPSTAAVGQAEPRDQR